MLPLFQNSLFTGLGTLSKLVKRKNRIVKLFYFSV